MSSSHSMTLAIRSYIDTTIASHRVVVFAKTASCVYSADTAALLRQHNVRDVHVVELDREHHGPLIAQQLTRITGRRDMPHVFVRTQYFGGNNDLQEAYVDGRLTKLLDEMNKAPPRSLLKKTILKKKVRYFANQAVQQHAVVIWSLSSCPSCDVAKRLFARLKHQGAVHDVKMCNLDQLPQGQQVRLYLEQCTGRTTLPVVFVHGSCIGGTDDAQHMQEQGTLTKLLKQI